MSLVSVIIPTYNYGHYIGQALYSLLEQEYPHWEAIVVDDGSVDETAAVVRAINDSRVFYVWQPNQGRSAARNHGLQLAKGDYVIFLDADDLLLPNCMSERIAALQSHPDCDACISDGEIMRDGEVVSTMSTLRRRYVPNYDRLAANTCVNILDTLVVSSPLVGAPHCVMVRRDVLQSRSLEFDPFMVMGEDWDFWVRLSETARYLFLDSVHVRYRWHDHNTLHSISALERSESILSGRERILRAAYFPTLSVTTQTIFFLQLLTEFLTDPVRQKEIIVTQAFQASPPSVQSAALRELSWNVCFTSQSLASHCLKRASELAGPISKDWILWHIWRQSPLIFRTLARLRAVFIRCVRPKSSGF